MRLNRNQVREHLDSIVENVITESCGNDSLLGDILMQRSPSNRRSIIIGGMLRMARQDDYRERSEWRERRLASL